MASRAEVAKALSDWSQANEAATQARRAAVKALAEAQEAGERRAQAQRALAEMGLVGDGRGERFIRIGRADWRGPRLFRLWPDGNGSTKVQAVEPEEW